MQGQRHPRKSGTIARRLRLYRIARCGPNEKRRRVLRTTARSRSATRRCYSTSAWRRTSPALPIALRPAARPTPHRLGRRQLPQPAVRGGDLWPVASLSPRRASIAVGLRPVSTASASRAVILAVSRSLTTCSTRGTVGLSRLRPLDCMPSKRTLISSSAQPPGVCALTRSSPRGRPAVQEHSFSSDVLSPAFAPARLCFGLSRSLLVGYDRLLLHGAPILSRWLCSHRAAPS
mmetsp:Transcript_38348/g.76829  ORF Transcript_38348/g.76829 Transcript_38348/m.76829 type:complete len:233 (+) Transcript_38348:177-875(+)